MSTVLARVKRRAALVIQRVGRSELVRRIPMDWKKRTVEPVKAVLGEAAFQTRDEANLLRGAGARRLALTVAVDKSAAAFDDDRLSVLAGKAKELAGLSHLDAVVTPARPAEETLVDEARREARDHRRRPLLDQLNPVRVDPTQVVPPLPAGITPMGYDREGHQRFLTLVPAAAAPHPSARASPGWDVALVAHTSLPDPLRRVDRWRRAIQPHVALLDHASHWPNPLARATAVTRIAGAGVPVVVADPDGARRDLAPFLPAPVIDALVATTAFDVTDPHRRERAAFAQWAAVHDHHGLRATWDRLMVTGGRPRLPRPTVSVVMATRRPETVPLWAHQMAAQVDVDVDFAVAFHGEGFTTAHEDQARAILGDRLTVIRTSDDHSLGDALNAASRAAGGELLVKWDDDDLYDRKHLSDLVRTHEYSGATVVGKATDYVHVGRADVTVRREQGRRETFSATVAGGTLCIRRGDLAAVGGWRRSPRRVDSLLIADVVAAGGLVYRALGTGYVMRRAAMGGHTWTVSDDTFLDPRFEQRRGLDLDFAGVSVPDEALAALVAMDEP